MFNRHAIGVRADADGVKPQNVSSMAVRGVFIRPASPSLKRPSRRASERSIASQITGRGLEVLPPPPLLLWGGGVGLLQVGEVCVADSAANRLQMKVDVLARSVIERLQQIRSELTARRTTQAAAPPDFANRVTAVIGVSRDRRQLLTQRLRVTQRLLDRRHPFGRQLLGEIRPQVFVGDGALRHQVAHFFCQRCHARPGRSTRNFTSRVCSTSVT